MRLSITSTPLHALTTLNDPTWVEAARVLAQNAMHRQDRLTDQLQFAFRRVLCRIPKPTELEILHAAWEKQYAIFIEDFSAATELLGIGQAKRDVSLDPAEHAALTAVCLAIFNLDEALTRE